MIVIYAFLFRFRNEELHDLSILSILICVQIAILAKTNNMPNDMFVSIDFNKLQKMTSTKCCRISVMMLTGKSGRFSALCLHRFVTFRNILRTL